MAYNDEERFLQFLGRRSFLRFWSWPNLFRDELIQKTSGDGKEISDLLVVFGNKVIIFSDKKIAFCKDKPLKVAWARWAKGAIYKSVLQVKGAKRWITENPTRIYIDKECSVRLPVQLPETFAVYEIIVCHGIDDVLQQHGLNSLEIDTGLAPSDHWDSEKCVPFIVGRASENGFVHVFTEKTIELVLSTFDTAEDFLGYLDEREKLLSLPYRLKIKNEADIILMYFESFDLIHRQPSILTSREVITGQHIIDKDGFAALQASRHYNAKKVADKCSYFVDDIINAFCVHVLAGTSEKANWLYPHEIEVGLRALASLNRFTRRVLADAFIQFYNKTPSDIRATRIVIDPANPKKAYLFLLYPYLSGHNTYEEYRNFRRKLLPGYCLIHRLERPGIEEMVAIAAQTKQGGRELDPLFFDQGQDFAYVDFSLWDESHRREAERLRTEYIANKFLTPQKLTIINHTNFPEETSDGLRFKQKVVLKGSERNKPCPCESGLKYKRCCGRGIF